MTERVFCIKRSSLNEIFDRFLDNTDYAFLPRKTKNREDDVEYSREYIQLIPYVNVILTGSESNKLIAYRRSGTMSGEKRLEGTWSIGFGGHISTDDCCFMPDGESYTRNDVDKLIYINVIRELYEELHLDPKLYNYEIFIRNTVNFLELDDDEPITVDDVHACVDVTVRINTNTQAYKEDTAFKTKLMENISLGTMAIIPHHFIYSDDTRASILSYIKENAKEGVDTDDVITLEKWSENKHTYKSSNGMGSGEHYDSLKIYAGNTVKSKVKCFELTEAFRTFGSDWVMRPNDIMPVSAIINNKVAEDIYAGEEPIRAPQVTGLTTVASIHEKDNIRYFKNIKKGSYIKVETLSKPTKNYEVGYIALEHNITAKTDDGKSVKTFAVPCYVLICCNT